MRMFRAFSARLLASLLAATAASGGVSFAQSAQLPPVAPVPGTQTPAAPAPAKPAAQPAAQTMPPAGSPPVIR
ncbi:MAG: hypothetical protein ACM36C_11420, partial [Acidobacteriota bacterium]